jgi:hypothetical protein
MRFAHCAHPGLGRNGSSGSTTAGQWTSPRLRRLTKSPTRLAVARGLPAQARKSIIDCPWTLKIEALEE